MTKGSTGVAAGLVMSVYAIVPLLSLFLFGRSGKSIESALFDIGMSLIPMIFTLWFTWRLVWPRWKLFAKLFLHPFIYLLLSTYLGHWAILIAWIHQGLLGLGGHIWFSNKHGFKWYAIDNPDRYLALSKQSIGVQDKDQDQTSA